MIAERFIGSVAKHARHNCNQTVLDSAKEIARIMTREVAIHTGDAKWCKNVISAIDRVCPEKKAIDEFKARAYKN